MTRGEEAALAARATRLTGRPLRLVRALPGGAHARTLLVADADGELVVRRFPDGDAAPEHEVGVLARLGSLGDLAPRLVAYGDGLVVTTRVPGGPPSPAADLVAAGAELGRTLSRIHALDGSGLREEPSAPPPSTGPLGAAARRAWPGLDLSGGVLTHWDFWSGNALWTGGRLTGVVDWSGARSAPRGVDVAWCRLDLVLMGSYAAADALLAAYRAASGRTLADIAAWDLQAAALAEPQVEDWSANYVALGRDDLTGPALRESLTRWGRDLTTPQPVVGGHP